MANIRGELILREDDEDTQKGKILTFQLENEVFGIEIKNVVEIIGVQPITYVPEVPAYVKGIINLRGQIIPSIDMRLRFNKEPALYNDRTCIIIIEIRDIKIGFIVDCVNEVIKISDENIVPPPTYRAAFHNPYIKGIGKTGDDVIILLDCEKIISDNEFEIINEMN